MPIPKRNPRIVWQQVNDRIIVHIPFLWRSDAFQHIRPLNASVSVALSSIASMVWLWVDGIHTVEEICEVLSGLFGRELSSQRIQDVIDRLRSMELISLKEE